MSDPSPRRRRTVSNTGGGGGGAAWLWTILGAIVVVALGWLLGLGLGNVFKPAPPAGPANVTATQAASPQPSPAAAATAPPSAAPALTPPPRKHRGTSALKPTPKPSPQPKPSATSAAVATPAAKPASPRPARAPSATPKPATPKPETPKPATAKPATPKPVVRPAAPSGDAALAQQTVGSYISALKNGDVQTAQSYLGNGTPDEDFIDANTEVSSMSSARLNDGSYRVRVGMKTARGTYYETFVVAPVGDGGKILEKSTVRP